MTIEEIKCANCIIERAIMQNATEGEIVNTNFINPFVFKKMAAFLRDEGLVEIIRSGGGAEVYTLTNKGHLLYESKKKIEGYLEEKEETENKQSEKEKRDDYFRILQIKDLEEKLNVMNVEQRDFWKTQKARNLQTTLIAIISAMFSLVALMKTWGFFD